MERVRVQTAAKMAAVENDMTTGAALSGVNLILTKKDGSTINTGNVKGVTGPSGAGVTTFYTAVSTYAHYSYTGEWWPLWNWDYEAGDATLVDLIERENQEVVPGAVGSPTSTYRDFWIKTTGLYLITFNYHFSGNGSTMNGVGRRWAAVHRNGSEIRRAACAAPAGSEYTSTEVSFPCQLTVGDKLTTMFFQDAGDAFTTGSTQQHRFTIVRLS